MIDSKTCNSGGTTRVTVHVNELYAHSITFQVLATRFHDDGCVRVMAVFDCFSIFAMEMLDMAK